MWHISRLSVPPGSKVSMCRYEPVRRGRIHCVRCTAQRPLLPHWSGVVNYAPEWLQRVAEIIVWACDGDITARFPPLISRGSHETPGITSFEPVNGALWSLAADIRINHGRDHEALCVKWWGETREGDVNRFPCFQPGCPYRTITRNRIPFDFCVFSVKLSEHFDYVLQRANFSSRELCICARH